MAGEQIQENYLHYTSHAYKRQGDDCSVHRLLKIETTNLCVSSKFFALEILEVTSFPGFLMNFNLLTVHTQHQTLT